VTLITGQTAISVGNEIYAYSQRVDFSAYASGAEATALDFTSPNEHYRCELTISLDTGSMSQNDILAIIIRGSGENLATYKWALGNPANFGAPITIPTLSVILPPNTIFKAILSLSSSTAMVGSGSVILVGRKIGR